ncbi:MAG: hypothetical protein ACYCO3_10660 [Mycobacteriales bacterium]
MPDPARRLELAIGVLDVLVITSGYSTGSIRTTLSAVPQRMALFGAKAVTVGSLSAAVGLTVSLGAFFVNQRWHQPSGFNPNVGRGCAALSRLK